LRLINQARPIWHISPAAWNATGWRTESTSEILEELVLSFATELPRDIITGKTRRLLLREIQRILQPQLPRAFERLIVRRHQFLVLGPLHLVHRLIQKRRHVKLVDRQTEPSFRRGTVIRQSSVRRMSRTLGVVVQLQGRGANSDVKEQWQTAAAENIYGRRSVQSDFQTAFDLCVLVLVHARRCYAIGAYRRWGNQTKSSILSYLV
jgi:hypothetical protein